MERELTCPFCGADAMETAPIGLPRAVWFWFRSGGPLPREMDVCGRCGRVSGYGSGSRRTVVFRARRWWQVPWQLYGAVRHRRSMIPAPATYAAAAAIGTLIGIMLDLLLPVVWWWFPLGAVVLVWAIFLSSAFRGDRPRHESLWNVLLGVFRPEVRAERMHRAQAGRFRGTDLPLYGVVGWTGFRFVGGSQLQDDEMVAAALVFRLTADHEPPDVRVETARADHAPIRITRDRLTNELASMALRRTDASPKEWFRDSERLAVELSRRTWSEHDLLVDGTPTPIRVLRERHAWVGLAVLDDHVVAIQAEGIAPEDVALERVTDVEPYIAGWRAFLAESRALHGH